MVIDRTCAARGASEGRSLHPSRQLDVDCSCLSAAASPALSAGMHTSGWRDVAVDAKMQLGVEPSSAVIIVIGTITVTLRTLRQCSRGCAHQQRHCHDKFRCTHGSISSRSRSTASRDCYRLMALFIRSEQSQDFVQSARQVGLSQHCVFPACAAPLFVLPFTELLRSELSTLGDLTRVAGRTSTASRGFFLQSAVARWDRSHRNRDNSRPLRIARASYTSSE